MRKIISRSQAIKKKLKKYYTGKKCKRGHLSFRYVAQRLCVLCNKETGPKYKAIYRDTTKAKINEKRYRDEYRKSSIGKKIIRKINKRYHKKKYASDKQYKVKHVLRGYLSSYIKQTKNKKINNFSKIIGCKPDQLVKHLESKFKPGMNWKNHGLRGWHIDHIVPISKAKNIKQIEKLFHYTNLQPLWARENILKRNK